MPTWVRWAGLGLAVLGSIWLSWRLINVLLIVAIALLLATAFSPVVTWFEERRVPRWLSTFLCFLVLLGALGGFLAYLVPLFAGQAGQLAEAMPQVSARMGELAERWAGWRGRYPFLPQFGELSARLAAEWGSWLERAIGMTGQVFAATLETITVLFLAFFFLKDREALTAEALRLLPPHARLEARPVLDRIGDRVGRYVLGRLIVMLIVGILTGVGLALVGVPYAALLGAIAGLLEIVPYLGPFLSAIPGGLLAFSESPTLGFWALAVYFLVQQAENYLISPFIVGRSVGLHPVWVVLALLIGAELMGVMGMILAVPVASTIQVLIEELYLPTLDHAVIEDA